MGVQKIDLRWVFVIVLVVLLLFLDELRIPWQLAAAVGLAAGAYLLNIGWQRFRESGGMTARPRVTYWRGERIVLDQPRRRQVRVPPWPTLTSAILYLLLGVTTIALVITRVLLLSL